MNNINYKEITCKKAINKSTGCYPYQYDLNIYRGCKHSCVYCYAVYSHKYLEGGSFFKEVFVKTNVVECLEREISSKNWKGALINLGSVTDSYQEAEKFYKFMPDILRLMIKYKNPICLLTKSDLLLRDIELFDKLSRLTYVGVGSSITSFDKKLRSLIEPDAVSSERRFNMLYELGRTKVVTAVFNMPVIPYITDQHENMGNIFRMAKEVKVDYLLSSTLNLRGDTRKMFFNFVMKEYPHIYHKMLTLYKNTDAMKEYKINVKKMINALYTKYGLSRNYMRVVKERIKETREQPLLFT